MSSSALPQSKRWRSSFVEIAPSIQAAGSYPVEADPVGGQQARVRLRWVFQAVAHAQAIMLAQRNSLDARHYGCCPLEDGLQHEAG